MKSLLRYWIVLLMLLGLQVQNVKAVTKSWAGGNTTGLGPNAWSNPNNWSPVGIPASTDDVSIGAVLAFANPPVVSSTDNVSCASITFGAVATLTSIPLTVNGTLNVTGAVTVLPTLLIAYTVPLSGTGTLNCGSIQINTTTNPGNALLNLTVGLNLIVTLANLNVSGNVTINSSYVAVLILGLGEIDGKFSLVSGTTTIGGQILTQNTLFGLLNLGTGTGIPVFSIDPGTGSNAVLNLTNAAAISLSPASGSTLAGYIDFYNSTGTGKATVNYSGANQVVYTTTTSILKSDPQTYQNLILSGTGTKTINGGNLTVGSDFTTSTTTPGTTSTTVAFNTNNPTTTIGGNWTSNASTTITGGTGTTTLTGNLSNAGTVNMASGNLTVAGNYSNSGTFTQAPLASNPTVGTPTNTTFFTNPSATLTGVTGNSTSFNNLVFTGGSGATPSITGVGAFSVSSVGVLQIKTAGTALSSANGLLTLKSDASGSASLAPLPSSTTSITGSVNVQRYANGGTGRRNYRLLSGPVNQSLITTGVPGYGFTDLQATTMISGYGAVGTYNGSLTPTPNSFDLTPLGNPSVFFYYEPDKDPNERLISKSDYKGLNTINEKFPIGNGFLFFFRGDRTINGLNGQPKTSITSTPQNTTMNFLGTLNQGTIAVNIPTNPTSTVNGNIVYSTPSTAVSPTFSYTPHTPNTNDGLHLMGNPYACAIDLDAITLTNSSANIYMLNNSGTFGVYQKGSGNNGLNNGVGRFVLSGQGFFIQANSSGTASLSFTEACKTLSPASTPTTFAIAKPRVLAMSKVVQSDAVQNTDVTEPTPHVMSISLTLDSVNNNETVIQFGEKTAKNSFDRQEDAYYMSGPAQTTFLASYTKDNQPCLVNHMGSLDSIKTIPLYAEGQTDGIYTLKFKGATNIDQRYKLYLVDNFKKDSLDLSANDTYNFNIQRADKTTFGATRFALVRHDSGLHYNLLSFNGTKQNNAVVVNWKTEYEGDYTHFILQRSTDGGKNYTNLDSLQGTGSGAYTYIDHTPVIGTNQYQLIQKTGIDPQKISKTVTVDFLLSTLNKFKLYPNPVNDILKIDIGAPSDNAISLNVKTYDINGLIVSNIETTANQTLSQDVSKLPRGTYILKVTGSNNKIYGTKTFIKL